MHEDEQSSVFSNPPQVIILNGWKEIACHMGRGVRTVQRWEGLGLPIRRPKSSDRSAVIAIEQELDAWVGGCSKRHSHGDTAALIRRTHALIEQCRRNQEFAKEIQERAAQSCARAQKICAEISAVSKKLAIAAKRNSAAVPRTQLAA